MDTNSRRNKEVLKNKSVSNRLNCMSECEENILNKVNSVRFVVNSNKVFVKNDVKFINNYTAPDKHNKYDEITEETKLSMVDEVNNIQFFT